MKRTFIINPRAGRGLAPADIAALEEEFRGFGPAEFFIPASREETTAAAREALRRGAEQVVAVGGDGTVNAVVNGFFDNGAPINPRARLAVSCSGGGCDYYTSITKNAPGTDWRRLVACHDVRMVDVGRVRFAHTAYGERLFVNMASAGMIADVVIKRERWNGYLPDWLAYTIPSAMSLFTFRPRPMEITVEGETRRLEALAVSVSKGSFAGGGMRFGLNVGLDDGRFEVTVFLKSNPVSMALRMGKMFSGEYAGEKEILKLHGRRVEIRCEEPLPVEFDGEVYGATDVVFEVAPRALLVCAPLAPV